MYNTSLNRCINTATFIKPSVFLSATKVTGLMGTANTPARPTVPKLLDQVTERLRTKHYSIRTEKQYVQ